MKILYLTQWFEPEPILKGVEFAAALKRSGHDVEVLTGFPNYPGGKVYEGFRLKAIQREEVEGVHVTRVALYPNHDRSSIKRILNYLSFAFSALVYCLFFMKRKDLIYVYHPPLTVPLVACVVSFLRRTPYILDVQDLWPDTLESTGMVKSSWVLGSVSFLADLVYRRAGHVQVISNGFKERLVKKGVPENKVSVVYNWANERALSDPRMNGSTSGKGKRGVFRLLFAGTVGMGQGLDAAIEAMSLLKKRHAPVELEVLGDGVDLQRIKALAANLELDNVRFSPRVPMDQVQLRLQQADALLVLLRDDPLFEITIPSKTQAYMYAGKPILMAVRGNAAEIIERSGAGVVAAPEPAALASAILEFIALSDAELVRLGRRAKEFYENQFSFSSGVGATLQTIERVCDR